MSLFTKCGRPLRLAVIVAVGAVCMFGCGGSATGGGAVAVVDPGTCGSGTVTDSRDDRTYKTVTIGGKTWLAENLNYQVDNSWCFDDESSNCDECGRLYDWNAASGACPEGWRLPTVQEWKDLVGMAGGKKEGGKRLRSKDLWEVDGNGTDDYGFAARLCGNRIDNGVYHKEYYRMIGNWWTSTEGKPDESALGAMMSGNSTTEKTIPKSFAMSARCVQND